MSETLDREVRLAVYSHFLAAGEPPAAAEVAARLGAEPADVEDAYRRLEAGRALVLAPGTLNVWMANPLCAVPTAFRVKARSGEWWGTCVWDALGIPAMLGEDAAIETSCGDCGEPLELRVRDQRLEPVEGVAHFAVPARSWWENIGYA